MGVCGLGATLSLIHVALVHGDGLRWVLPDVHRYEPRPYCEVPRPQHTV
jgi:hypothetical protein